MLITSDHDTLNASRDNHLCSIVNVGISQGLGLQDQIGRSHWILGSSAQPVALRSALFTASLYIGGILSGIAD